MQRFIASAMGGQNLQVVYLGQDLLPRLYWQNAAGQWSWYGIDGLLPNGGPLTSIAMSADSAGGVHVLGIGAVDRRPYVITQNSAGAWSFDGALTDLSDDVEEPPLTGCFDVTCGVANDGSFQVLVLFTDIIPLGGSAAAYALPKNSTVWQPCGRGTEIPGLEAAGVNVSAGVITAISNPGNLLTAIGSGPNPDVPPVSDRTPYILTQMSPEPVAPPGPWEGIGAGWIYSPLPALPAPWTGKDFFATASCAAALGALQGYVVVVSLGADDGLPYCFLQYDNTWSFLGQLPSNTDVGYSQIAMVPGPSGSLQITLLGWDGIPYLIYTDPQLHVADNDLLSLFFWGGRIQPPGMGNQWFTALEAATGADGNLQLILGSAESFGGVSSPLALIWQSARDGSWHWYGSLY